MSDTVVAPSVGRAQEDEEIPVLFLQAVERHYRQGDETLHILNGAELAIWPGQSVALVAPSGAGKSTLLHIAGLLEHPDHGDVYIDGRATAILPDHERTRIRRNEIGFVYQSHHLLPEFTALENVLLPQMIRGLTRARRRKRAAELSGLSGFERPAQSPAGRTVRRRAAARGDCARGRQCTAHSAGRRADRKSRSAHRRPRVRCAHATGAGLGARHHHRHPQHGACRPHGPAGDVARGHGGGAGVSQYVVETA